MHAVLLRSDDNVHCTVDCDPRGHIGQTPRMCEARALAGEHGGLPRPQLGPRARGRYAATGASAPADSGEASERDAEPTSSAETFCGW